MKAFPLSLSLFSYTTELFFLFFIHQKPHSILSKLLLTRKESFDLYFTTQSTCLESGLGLGEYGQTSEATSSTGGLTISSAGMDGESFGSFSGSSSSGKKVLPLPIVVDWNMSPQALRMRMNGCYLWIKRNTTDITAPVDLDAEATAAEQVQRMLEEARPYDPSLPFEYLVGVTSNSVAYCFVAKRDIHPGQVIFRENLKKVEAYQNELVSYVAENKMLTLNLPYEKDFEVESTLEAYTNEEFSKAMSQATTNGVAVGDTLGFAPWASVFKRSCWPNAMSFLSPDKRTVDVVAISEVAQGDEVTLPWDCIVDQFWLPQERRQEYIRDKFRKTCSCGRCLQPSTEDKTLTGAFFSGDSKLAVQVMRAEYASALENCEKQQMVTFLQRYMRSDEDASSDIAKPSVQLHKNHWRICTLRDRLLNWYRASPKKRMDKRLPALLLDQLEMCTSVMPKLYPPKLKAYRQWKDLLNIQSSHVAALLKRMAKDRTGIEWSDFAQLDALEQYWNEVCGESSDFKKKNKKNSSLKTGACCRNTKDLDSTTDRRFRR